MFKKTGKEREKEEVNIDIPPVVPGKIGTHKDRVEARLAELYRQYDWLIKNNIRSLSDIEVKIGQTKQELEKL